MARLEDGDYISYIDELSRSRSSPAAPPEAPVAQAPASAAAAGADAGARAGEMPAPPAGREPAAVTAARRRSHTPWASRPHGVRRRGGRPHLELTPAAQRGTPPRTARRLAAVAAASVLTPVLITVLHLEQPWQWLAAAAAMLALTTLLLGLQARRRSRQAAP